MVKPYRYVSQFLLSICYGAVVVRAASYQSIGYQSAVICYHTHVGPSSKFMGGRGKNINP